jgi:predicted PhzF superfamily epimerase YddE/YHI9
MLDQVERGAGSTVSTVEGRPRRRVHRDPLHRQPRGRCPDATGLDDAAMRAIAAELARPATAFLLSAVSGGERGLRWFSPTGVELTLCGHGTVATAHVLATRGEAPDGRLLFRSLRHRLPVTLAGGGTSCTAWFEPDCARWVPESGDLLIPVVGLEALRTLTLDLGELGRVAKDRRVRRVMLTTREARKPGAFTHSRNFIPHFGIPEDFATGSSHAAIGVWLWETGGLATAATADGVAGVPGGGHRALGPGFHAVKRAAPRAVRP